MESKARFQVSDRENTWQAMIHVASQSLHRQASLSFVVRGQTGEI